MCAWRRGGAPTHASPPRCPAAPPPPHTPPPPAAAGGSRGGQLPFGIGKAPTEVGYSAGLGRSFSQGRGRLDVGIERLQRKGTGLTERVWTLLLGLTVRP